MCIVEKSPAQEYLELWTDRDNPEIVPFVCSVALRLDDELAIKLIEQVAGEQIDRPKIRGMVRRLKNSSFVWPDHPSWSIHPNIRLPWLQLLRDQMVAEDLVQVYQTLVDHAEAKAVEQVASSETGQVAAYRLRRAIFEAAFYRLHIPQEEEAGAQAMRDLYDSSPSNAQEAIKKAIASLLKSGELDPKWAYLLEQE